MKKLDILKPLRENPEEVKEFISNPAHLRNEGFDAPSLTKFPLELLKCTNLEIIEIYRGIDDPNIPEEIGQLKNLKKLRVGGNGTKRLPESVGQLINLKILDVVYESLEALPESIGDLKNLEEISLIGCSLKTLPASIAQCKNLRRLSLDRNETFKAKACELIWELDTLEELDLPEHIKKLPKGIGRLKNLKKLSLSASALISIEDELTHLKSLHYLRTPPTDEKHEYLPSVIGELEELEELDLACVGLLELPLLHKLQKLKKLSIGGNQLKTLYETIVSLPALEELDFSGNPLVRGEKKKINDFINQKLGIPSNIPRPKILRKMGDIFSENASLIMLLADAELAQHFEGTENGQKDDENNSNSDWDRLDSQVLEKNIVRFKLSKGYGLGFSLDMGSGIASVWKVDDRLVIFEGDDPYDEDLFREYLTYPHQQIEPNDVFEINSGISVILPSTESGKTINNLVLNKEMPKKGAKNCGAEKTGLAIEVPVGTYGLFIDTKEGKYSWGSGRRAIIIPMQTTLEAPKKEASTKKEQPPKNQKTSTQNTIAEKQINLIFQSGTSNKFWNAEVDGKIFRVRYGKIGTEGQQNEKNFTTEAEAEKAYEKKVAEKLREGYGKA